jgi:aminoglycoside/choline kinase family phosphotransferase
MQYDRDANGNLTPLPKQNVDTGAGLERFASILQGKTDNYDTDLFVNLKRAVSDVTGVAETTENVASFKVITDHLRSVGFAIADGVIPSNTDRGYVIRRILRRAMRHGQILGHRGALLSKLYPALITEMGDAYPELAANQARVVEIIQNEENAFADIPHVKESLASAGKSADEKISFLGVRGSERAFFAAADAVVVVYDDTNRRENALYASHARFLSERGIPVPKILAFKPELKTLVLENAGKEKETTLEEKLRIVESLYSFNSLGKLFLDGANGTLPELSEIFGPETWKWERELFEKYSLQEHFSIEMPDDVARQLESVGELLEREEKSLVHRDFQSSNILWKGSDFSFIDFQGMRLGPAVYDLASFVYDPYVNIPERHRDALILHYSRLAQRPEIVSLVPYAAVQRLIQCLGAYGRLASVGQKQFSKYIMPALENLLDAADKANLDAVGALAEDLIAAEKRMGGR